jgi:hypothetical protein
MTAPAVDVYITGGGNVFLFLLRTPAAHHWVDENVSENRLMLDSGLAVEWRYAAALAEGMQEGGLVITDREVQP